MSSIFFNSYIYFRKVSDTLRHIKIWFHVRYSKIQGQAIWKVTAACSVEHVLKAPSIVAARVILWLWVWRWKRSRVQCWEEGSPESHCPGQLLGSAGGFVGEVAEKCANPLVALGRDCNCSYRVLRWRSRRMQTLSMWCWRLARVAATYCFSYRRRQFLV